MKIYDGSTSKTDCIVLPYFRTNQSQVQEFRDRQSMADGANLRRQGLSEGCWTLKKSKGHFIRFGFVLLKLMVFIALVTNFKQLASSLLTHFGTKFYFIGPIQTLFL